MLPAAPSARRVQYHPDIDFVEEEKRSIRGQNTRNERKMRKKRKALNRLIRKMKMQVLAETYGRLALDVLKNPENLKRILTMLDVDLNELCDMNISRTRFDFLVNAESLNRCMHTVCRDLNVEYRYDDKISALTELRKTLNNIQKFETWKTKNLRILRVRNNSLALLYENPIFKEEFYPSVINPDDDSIGKLSKLRLTQRRR